ncbi:helix-turn-helix domain-containing protein [Seramator thermalis]|uniref:helix-turn-helix domain-containing protein n=1 Tax=Seramator thermalis TaxID=2496270 RepID=UPI00101D5084|nr:helix-turn-helix domain-containing protein [Seramator thermalis]
MSKPRLLADILKDYFQNSQEQFAIEFRRHFNIQPIVNLDLVSNETLNTMVENSFLEDWIDGQIVMQTLHVSPRTLQTLRTNGTLPYTKFSNGKIFYLRQDVEKILKQNYSRKGSSR